MLSYLGCKNNLYYVSDSEDSSIDTVTYSELYNCIVNLGIKIKGVLYCKRTNSLLCEVISGGVSKSTRFFKEEVYNLYGCDYTVLGNYTKGTDKILI